jgi:hypothetical protein
MPSPNRQNYPKDVSGWFLDEPPVQAGSEEQLTAIRGGLTAEEYRWKLIREFS